MDLERIYREYFTIVYRYMLSISKDPQLAEEIAQETFARAFQKIRSFRGDCDISVWLCQIAKNEYFQHLKKQKKKSFLNNSTEGTVAGPETELIRKETQLQIQQILNKMEDTCKEVFYMRTYGEMSYKDIGKIFGKKETWARVTYYRVRKKIMEVLEDEDNL